MPDLVVSGRIVREGITTTLGRYPDELGGDATYAALAASKFCRVGVVSAVGLDFNADTLYGLAQTVDTEGVAIGKTLEHINPDIPDHFLQAPFQLVTGMGIRQQTAIADEVAGRYLVVQATKEWTTALKERNHLLKHAKTVIVSADLASALFSDRSERAAALQLLQAGPGFVVFDRGPTGALLFSSRGIFAASGYPVQAVVDTTGYPATFAGALAGFLANQYQDASNLVVNEPIVRKAIVGALAAASFTVEGIGTQMLEKISLDDVRVRYEELKKIHQF